MYQINHITGFESFRPVNVYSENGDLFLEVTRQSEDGMYRFNLPKGRFNIAEPVKKTKPRNYAQQVKEPPRDRDKNGNYTVHFSENPQVGTICHKSKNIILDQGLRMQPIHRRKFVLLHEMGHTKHSSEKGADMFAVKKMLLAGYDPEHCIDAVHYLRNRRHKSVAPFVELLRKIKR